MSKNSARAKESIVWTFNKARRFYPLRRVHTPEFIDVQSTLSDRSCSFGKGKRWTPINETGKDAPSPGTYETPSSFGQKNKGPTLKKRPKLNLKKNIVPGPGSYTPYSPLGKHAPKFTFRQKFFTKTRCSTPPPGTYRPSFAKIEKNIYKDIVFGKGQRPDIYGKLEDIPGPGTYDIRGRIGNELTSNKNSSKIFIKRSKSPLN